MNNTINYIDVNDIFFYLSEGGLLCLKYKGKDVGRVAAIRMFPFEYEDEYIALRCENYSRHDKEKEIGIIRNVSDLPEEQAKLLTKELQKRYFIPDIIEVFNLKEDFGHTTWQVDTTAGKREFSITDMGTNVRNLGGGRILLTDVFGNRYYIKDLEKLGDKTLKVLEIWI